MKNYYYILLPLILAACSSLSNSEVIMKASPDKRPSKSEYMPTPEKPLKTHESEEIHHLPTLAPRLGIRVPLDQ